MKDCKFVRKNCVGYEYGHIMIHNAGAKNERREYVVEGKALSYEAALELNTMAYEGMPKIRAHVAPTYWD